MPKDTPGTFIALTLPLKHWVTLTITMPLSAESAVDLVIPLDASLVPNVPSIRPQSSCVCRMLSISRVVMPAVIRSYAVCAVLRLVCNARRAEFVNASRHRICSSASIFVLTSSLVLM